MRFQLFRAREGILCHGKLRFNNNRTRPVRAPRLLEPNVDLLYIAKWDIWTQKKI